MLMQRSWNHCPLIQEVVEEQSIIFEFNVLSLQQNTVYFLHPASPHHQSSFSYSVTVSKPTQDAWNHLPVRQFSCPEHSIISEFSISVELNIYVLRPRTSHKNMAPLENQE